jgi:release factor glutamine methyltransferase
VPDIREQEAGTREQEAGTRERATALHQAIADLAAAGIPEPRREALLIWSELAGPTPGATLVLPDARLSADLAVRFRQAVARRAAGEPRQYVVGTVGFRRLILGCDRRALIPRPETEGLVDLALARGSTGRALDLGTGSGCLALALADEAAYDEVVGIDRSPAALALARENGTRTGLSVRWVLGDWVKPVSGERFDVIVTNPPYIAAGELRALHSSVRDWEPEMALNGGPDGLAEARRILTLAPAILRAGGWLFMELDAARAAVTAEVATASGWRAVRVLDDLYRRPRYLAAQWEPDNA